VFFLLALCLGVVALCDLTLADQPVLGPCALVGCFYLCCPAAAALLDVLQMRNRERRWTAPLIEASKALGLNFRAELPREDVLALASLPLFRLTAELRQTVATDCMGGSLQGHEVMLFTYEFDGEFEVDPDSSVKDGARQTVVVVRHAGLPNFVLAPTRSFWVEVVGGWLEDPGCAAARTVGGVFRRRYVLWAPDEAAAQALFTFERVAFFERSPGWTVESWNGWLLTYGEGKVCEPERYPILLLKALDILTVLTRQHGQGLPAGNPPAAIRAATPREGGKVQEPKR
jgi:hypothetical protein